MDDPLGPDRLMLYARMVKRVPGSGDRPFPGLFTRPPVLAASDETDDTDGNLPINAMNLACRILMKGEVSPGGEGLSIVAGDCGFQDVRSFIEVFIKATGWHPLEWNHRFRSG